MATPASPHPPQAGWKVRVTHEPGQEGPELQGDRREEPGHKRGHALTHAHPGQAAA